MSACLFNHVKVVRILLTYSYLDTDCYDNQGKTASFIACEEGNIEILEELIDKNANINKCAANGMSLMIAIKNNHIHVATKLLSPPKSAIVIMMDILHCTWHAIMD